MSKIDRYIDLILERVEVNKDEHRNLKSELTSLLNEKKENYRARRGYGGKRYRR